MTLTEMPQVAEKQVFKLGYCLFALKHCKPAFVSDLAKLLPRASEAESTSPEIYDLDMNCTEDPRGLFNHLLRRHYKCLWVDAACLISPSGKKVLLCGPTGAGKSTLALALATKFNWSIVSEDVTLIDPETNRILNFAAPFLIDSNSLRLVTEVVGETHLEVILKQWISLGEFANEQDQSAPFDTVIYLANNNDQVSIKIAREDASESMQKLLAISNIARKQGTERFFSYLPESACYALSNGSLQEKLDAIQKLSSDAFSNLPLPGDLVTQSENSSRSQIDAKFVRASHVACSLQGDGTCLIAGKRDDIVLVLAPAASLIWEFCDGQHSVQEILNQMHSLGVPLEFDQQQILGFVNELVEDGLLFRVS